MISLAGTVHKADGNDGHPQVNVGIAAIIKMVEPACEQGVQEQEGQHIEAQQEPAWDEQVEVNTILIHVVVGDYYMCGRAIRGLYKCRRFSSFAKLTSITASAMCRGSSSPRNLPNQVQRCLFRSVRS